MIEFMSPYDIMEKFVDVIEKERVSPSGKWLYELSIGRRQHVEYHP